VMVPLRLIRAWFHVSFTHRRTAGGERKREACAYKGMAWSVCLWRFPAVPLVFLSVGNWAVGLARLPGPLVRVKVI